MNGHPVMSRRQFLAGPVLGGGRDAVPVPYVSETCLPFSGIVCQTCGDTCPEAAIRFPPRLGGPAGPSVNFDACTGCGECAPACPVGAIEMRERPETVDG